MRASLLSCHWTLVHLDHQAEERKLRYGQIITQKHIENENKKISSPPPSDSQNAQTCFLGCSKQCHFFETKNGHEWGAICSNRDETLSSDTSVIWGIFWEGRHGAWGAGALGKVEKCVIMGNCF